MDAGLIKCTGEKAGEGKEGQKWRKRKKHTACCVKCADRDISYNSVSDQQL